MWNYRIIKHKDKSVIGHHFALHEVYYNKDGKIWGWTENPTDVLCDGDEGPEIIEKILKMMLKDVQKHEILDEEILEKERVKPDFEVPHQAKEEG